MSLTATQTCRIRSFLSVCREQSIGTCVYCGRAFCSRHCTVRQDGQEICTRKECVAKRDDLARHMSYKGIVQARNDASACGITSCGNELSAQCVRCNGLFCEVHVHRREESILENQVKVHRMATLCQHCSARRNIWTKV